MRAWWVIGLALVACGKDDDDDNDNDNDIFEGDNGAEVPSREPDETVQANLAAGDTMDLDWASAAFCWTASSNVAFNGAHVLFERTQPDDTAVFARASPEDGLDVSLYYLQRSAGVTALPPDLSETSIFDCDASFDVDGNRGQPEAVEAPAHNEFPLVLGVAGADGEVDGSFTLEIWFD